MPEPVRNLLSTPDVAARLGVCEQTVRYHIRSGHLRGYRVGRNFRVDPSDLAEYLDRSHSAVAASCDDFRLSINERPRASRKSASR